MDISSFMQIEKKYNLYHIEIDGIQPWTYFRYQFWNYYLCRDLLGLSDNQQKPKPVKICVRQLKSVIDIVLRRNRKRLCKADILFYVHPRRIEADGYYESIYTDWLTERYASHMALEGSFNHGHMTPVREEHLFYTDLLQIRSDLYAKLSRYLKSRRYRRAYEQIKERFEEPLEEFGKVYQCDMKYDRVYAQMAELVLGIPQLKREFKKLIEEVEPKVIVEVVSYNRQCMVLNELSKEQGIPTIELQHGIMHAAHVAYRFPDGCGVIRQFPDYVFVFSEYWKKCGHLPISDTHIKVTGYPYFERQIQKYAGKSSCKSGQINILFVSQGAIGKELSRLATELSGLLDANKYHLIYKLHPGEYEGWRDRTPWLVNDNIEVVDSPKHNIYEYFSKCDVQIGVYSTAIYEGLAFGLETFIYNIGHADSMKDLCELGYAVNVGDAKELYEQVLLTRLDRCNGRNDFWEMNAEENICSELDKILERGE